jgi:hypothetical protein
MTEPLQPAAAPAHQRHDRELIAALAARVPDLPPRDLATARGLVEQCGACRDLLTDLLALQVALPASSTPARPRDFTLAVADAQRMRRGGWRRVVGFFGSARDGFSQPLAIGLTTVGVVALMVTAIPNISLGGAGGASTQALSPVGAPVSEAAPAAAPSAAPSAAAAMPSAAPAASRSVGSDRLDMSAEPYESAVDQGGLFSGSNEGDAGTGDTQGSGEEASGDSGLLALRGDDGPSLGIVIAGICLIVGLGLFVLRWTSRRLGEG